MGLIGEGMQSKQVLLNETGRKHKKRETLLHIFPSSMKDWL